MPFWLSVQAPDRKDLYRPGKHLSLHAALPRLFRTRRQQHLLQDLHALGYVSECRIARVTAIALAIEGHQVTDHEEEIRSGGTRVVARHGNGPIDMAETCRRRGLMRDGFEQLLRIAPQAALHQAEVAIGVDLHCTVEGDVVESFGVDLAQEIGHGDWRALRL